MVRVKGTFKLGLMGSVETERAMGIAHIAIGKEDYVFAHFKDCEPEELYNELKDGDPVDFEMGMDPKGRRALKIRRAT
jgi:cold shock CspA family protein